MPAMLYAPRRMKHTTSVRIIVDDKFKSRVKEEIEANCARL